MHNAQVRIVRYGILGSSKSALSGINKNRRLCWWGLGQEYTCRTEAPSTSARFYLISNARNEGPGLIRQHIPLQSGRHVITALFIASTITRLPGA